MLAALVSAILQSSAWASETSLDIENRIQRVENGLLNPVSILGRTNTAMALTERMRFYKVPGVSIAVINNGGIEWARGYGVLDAESKVPVTSDSLFQAASISKPVFAMAALSLVEKGTLLLDEDVNAKLKSWKLPDNQFTREQKVTLRSLLTHTGGTTPSGFKGYATGQPLPTVSMLLDGVSPANSAPVRVDKVPGGAFRYSGGGMMIAQLLVSDATGQPIARFIKESVLDPIGMKHSSYEQPMPTSLENSAASGHNGAGVPIKGKWNIYPEQVAAGLWTTPSDLALFAIEMQKSRAGTSNKVLSKAMSTQMLTRSQTSPFGLGIVVSPPNKTPSFNHSGANEGFRTLLFAYTEAGKGAVVMTNGDAGSEVIAEVMRSLAVEYGWSDYQVVEKTLAVVDAKTLATYAGDYSIQGTDAEIRMVGARLFLKTAPLGPEAIELLPDTETNFFMLTSPTLLSFTRAESGAVSLEVTVKGQKIKASRANK